MKSHKQNGRKRSTQHGRSGSVVGKWTRVKRLLTGRSSSESAPSGTTPTEAGNISQNFSFEGICAIISACAEGKVSRFSLGDLVIEFPPHTQSSSAIESLPNHTYEFSATPDSGQPTEVGQDYDRELLEDLQASQKMIDDPLGFEREIINSHIRGDV